MITHLQIDFLEPGQLPWYEAGTEDLHIWYLGDVTPTTDGTWEHRTSRHHERVMLNTAIDIGVVGLADKIRPKLAELPQDVPGSILFVVQHAYNLDTLLHQGMEIVSNTSTIDPTLVVPGASIETITVTTNNSSTSAPVITNAYPLPTLEEATADEPPPRQGLWVLAGLAFIENAEWGTRLGEGDDALTIMIQACEAFLEPVTNELHDAITAAAMRYHDPANPRHLFPTGERMTNEAIAEAIERRRLKKAKAEAVLERARQLLLSCLSPYERYEFEVFGEFHVLGKDGFHYVIEERFGHNVFRVEDGERTWKYCLVYENWSIPRYDLMLGQKLLLENDPDTFFETANAWKLP